MTIDPGLAHLITGSDGPTDWALYRACGVCGAPAGHPCFALYARVVDGQRDGLPAELAQPHGFRRRSTRR